MGYRHTVITNDISRPIPDWFRTKWEGLLNLYDGDSGVISSKVEKKIYVWEGDEDDSLESDLRKWVEESSYPFRIIMVIVGESGDIIRNIITPTGGEYLPVIGQENETY